LATDGANLYVADSEVSAIRSVSLNPSGDVGTLAGGELFEFGLRNGNGTAARFQHPLGIVALGSTVYVADTYNNAIRTVNTRTGAVATLWGTGQAGYRDGDNPLFDEPNDVEIVGDTLYIADTNNHRIRLARIGGHDVTTLAFANPEALRERGVAAANTPANVVELSPKSLAPGAVTLVVNIRFPHGYHLNGEAPSTVRLVHVAGDSVISSVEGPNSVASLPVRIPVAARKGTGKVAVDLVLYYCEERAESLCYVADLRLVVPLSVADGGRTTAQLDYAVDARMAGVR
jgi:hypothetical protein